MGGMYRQVIVLAEEGSVVKRGNLFSSLASPGHLETETVWAGNPGVQVVLAAPDRVGGIE